MTGLPNIALKFTARVKKMYVETQRVIEKMARAKARGLMRDGGFLRQIARRSIRPAASNVYSNPGEPPKSHGNAKLRNWLDFAVESTENVVVGPAKLNMLYWNSDGRPQTGTVPEVLEYGGTIGVFEVFEKELDPLGLHGGPFPAKWRRADLRSKRRIAEHPLNEQRLRWSKIEARPFMRPALAKGIASGKLESMWANSVTGG